MDQINNNKRRRCGGCSGINEARETTKAFSPSFHTILFLATCKPDFLLVQMTSSSQGTWPHSVAKSLIPWSKNLKECSDCNYSWT